MLSEYNNILINDISELNGDELEPDCNFNLEVDINQSDYDYKQEDLPQEIKSQEKNDNTVTLYEGESEQFTINHPKDFSKDECEEVTCNQIMKIMTNTQSKELSTEEEEKNEEEEFKNRYFIQPEQIQQIQQIEQQPPIQPIIVEEDKFFNKAEKKELSKIYEKDPIFKINNSKTKKDNKNDRKNGPDNIRKVHKAHFSTKIIKKLNKKLEEYNMPMLSKFPQIMVTDLTINNNKKNLKTTLEKMLSERNCDYKLLDKKRRRKKKGKIQLWGIVRRYFKIKEYEGFLERNQEAMKILKKNNIREIDKLLHMKMKDIYEEYFESPEFQDSIKELIKKGNYYHYIYNYIKVGEKFVNYYEHNKRSISLEE